MQLPLRQKSLFGGDTLQLRMRCRITISLPSCMFLICLSYRLPKSKYVLKHCKHAVQVGRGTVSLADAYAHSCQESKVPLVTPAGKHAGEVEVFFVFASKEVGLVQQAFTVLQHVVNTLLV